MKYCSVCLSIILLFSCSNKGKWEGTITKENGIMHIHNSENGIWHDKKKMVLKKILSIGSENSDIIYTLARPYGVKNLYSGFLG